MKELIRPAALGGNTLVRDYLAGSGQALSFYSGSPFSLAPYRQKLEEVTRRFGLSERQAAAQALRPTSGHARARLDRFVAEGGAMVTTGQQAGFLTGPLYTVYKALSAVALARHLEEKLGVIVIPVFWVASEDHDWEEVNHAYLLDSRLRLRRFQLAGAEPRPIPMSERKLEGDLESLCDHILEVVAPQADMTALARQLVEPYRNGGQTIAGAFTESIARLLAPFDVCVADAADPALKRTSTPLLAHSLAASAEQESALTERSRALESNGYHVQVAVLPGGTNLFRQGEMGRERLYRRDGEFLVRERKSRFSAAQLSAELESDPSRFSPNVFLRPLVESTVFPTLAYVGGPGEVAYFAQAGALFELNGIVPPVVVPRYCGLVVEPKVGELLEELDLTLEDSTAPREALVERLARREVPAGVHDSLARLRSDLVSGFDTLAAAADEIDSALAGAIGSLRNRALLIARAAERKVIRSIKRSDRIATAQLDCVLDSIRPLGHPQDRTLNVLPFLARYDGHFLLEVEAAIQRQWRLPEDS